MSNYKPRLSPSTQKLLGWNVDSITAEERYDLLSSVMRKDEARDALPDTNSKDFERLKSVYANECDVVAVVRRNLNDRYGVTEEARASRLERSEKTAAAFRKHIRLETPVDNTDSWSLVASDGDDYNKDDDTKTARGWNGIDNDNFRSTKAQKTEALKTKQTEKTAAAFKEHIWLEKPRDNSDSWSTVASNGDDDVKDDDTKTVRGLSDDDDDAKTVRGIERAGSGASTRSVSPGHTSVAAGSTMTGEKKE